MLKNLIEFAKRLTHKVKNFENLCIRGELVLFQKLCKNDFLACFGFFSEVTQKMQVAWKNSKTTDDWKQKPKNVNTPKIQHSTSFRSNISVFETDTKKAQMKLNFLLEAQVSQNSSTCISSGNSWRMQVGITERLDSRVFESLLRIFVKCGGKSYQTIRFWRLKKCVRIGKISQKILDLAFSKVFGMCKVGRKICVSKYLKTSQEALF